MKWIRAGGRQKYHAVFAELASGVHTYCDRPVDQVEIDHRADERPGQAVCRSCVRCIGNPLLISARMREMRIELDTRNAVVHRERHAELHRAFDELVACYLIHNRGKVPSTTTVAELMAWSSEQTKGAV